MYQKHDPSLGCVKHTHKNETLEELASLLAVRLMPNPCQDLCSTLNKFRMMETKLPSCVGGTRHYFLVVYFETSKANWQGWHTATTHSVIYGQTIGPSKETVVVRYFFSLVGILVSLSLSLSEAQDVVL